MLRDVTSQTLELIKSALAQPIEKATLVQPAGPTLGLQMYNLEKPAKRLYPVLTPLRNFIKRVGPGFGTAVNWKAVTQINSTRVHPGIAEGARGGQITITTAEYSAAYRALGLEADATFEAKYAGRGFVDVRNEATSDLLDSFFMMEEEVLLGGNNSIALGVPTAPSGVAANVGAGETSTMAARNVVAYVVALTHQGYLNANRTNLAVGVLTTASRTNADGTTTTVKYGSSNKSAASAAVAVGAGQKCTWTWPAVRGAFGYALYTGLAGAEKLMAITTTNKYVQFEDELVGSQAAAAIIADNSQDDLVYDGVLPQIIKAGNNGYWKSMDGLPLTPDNRGGVVEIDVALRHFWDNARLSPDVLWVHAQEFDAISKAIVTGGSSAPAISISMNGSTRSLMGGVAVATYLNKFAPGGARELKVMIHPSMLPGTMLFWTNGLPYKLSGVPSIFELEERQSYYMLEWPLRTRKYEFGIYCDAVLKCYAPFAMGIINNIGPAV